MKLLKSKLFSVLMIVVIGWLSLSFIKIKLQADLVNKEIGDLEAEVAELGENNNRLGDYIGYMKNPSFLEKEARLRLNYKAVGEKVAFVYPRDNSELNFASVGLDVELSAMPNYIKWWYYIFGY